MREEDHMFVSAVKRKVERGESAGCDAGAVFWSSASSGDHVNDLITNNMSAQAVCSSELKAINIKDEHKASVIKTPA